LDLVDLVTEAEVEVSVMAGGVVLVIVAEMTEEMIVEEVVEVIGEMVNAEEEVVVLEEEEAEEATGLATTATKKDIWQENVQKETEEIEEDDR